MQNFSFLTFKVSSENRFQQTDRQRDRQQRYINSTIDTDQEYIYFIGSNLIILHKFNMFTTSKQHKNKKKVKESEFFKIVYVIIK